VALQTDHPKTAEGSPQQGVLRGALGGYAVSAPALLGLDEGLAGPQARSRDRLRSARGHHREAPLAATVLRLKPGIFDPTLLTAGHEDSLGLLVLDGLMVVELKAGRSRVGWLIGVKDLIRPWQLPEIAIATTPRWRALTETRIAVLDHRFHQRAATTLGLIDELLARMAHTTHWLLSQSLLLTTPSVHERLLLWFALCGERWGKVTPDGVALDLPLTHDLLGALVGARRPTVTLALKSLEAAGFLTRNSSQVWLVSPQGRSYASHTSSCAAQCANALGLNLLGRTDEARPNLRSSADAA
jgi:CRP/FNR family transcriptional regulator, cyclic AMP receptor protein